MCILDRYGVSLSENPVVVYGDTRGLYNKEVADRLVKCGQELGIKPQSAYWQSYGSDASIAKALGQTPKAGLVCIPTENTHGFEIIHRNSLHCCVSLLASYLENPE